MKVRIESSQFDSENLLPYMFEQDEKSFIPCVTEEFSAVKGALNST